MRVTPRLAARPIAAPTATRRRPREATMRSTSARPAPSAMRMPISCVCRETVYAMTLYTTDRHEDQTDAREDAEQHQAELRFGVGELFQPPMTSSKTWF